MTPLEIALLIIGALIFIFSFAIPVKKKETSEEIKEMISDEVKLNVKTEIEELRSHINNVVDEAIDYAQEKTERSLERISNEKIMAVNEYSDTVLDEINKNHKEVMFLYDMLNSKQEDLKQTVSEASVVAKTAKESAEQALGAAEAVSESTKEVEAAASSFKALVPEQISFTADNGAVNNSFGNNSFSGNENMSVFGSAEPENENPPQETASEIPQLKPVQPDSEPRVRTLKWAEFALEQADVAYEAEKEKEAQVSAPSESQAPQSHLHDQVIALHKLGKSDIDIARALGIGVGEVSLIIGLHAR